MSLPNFIHNLQFIFDKNESDDRSRQQYFNSNERKKFARRMSYRKISANEQNITFRQKQNFH